LFPDAPYIARPGNINAWDNEDFVNAVKATRKKQLLIAGIVTEVCVAFPALSARKEGYEVFIVTDASGTFNKTTRDAAWTRMTQAGCQLMSCSELHANCIASGVTISKASEPCSRIIFRHNDA
jgi:nicotinamidase-related amidase